MAASGGDWRDSLLAIVCPIMPAGYPTVRPHKMLDLTNNSQLDSDFVHTRATTATFVNASGFQEVAPANTPRPNYDPMTGQYLGLLMEASSTNLLPWSNDISQPSWYYAPQNAPLQSGFIGVSNTASAYRIGEGTVPGLWEIGTTIALSSGTQIAHSAFIKSDGVSKGYLQFIGLTSSGEVAGNILVNFDLKKGEVYPENYGTNLLAAKIEQRRNGWCRIGALGNIAANATTGLLLLRLRDDDDSTFYQGRGRGLLVDGFQVESNSVGALNSFISSFVPTSGVALSRAGDLLRSQPSTINLWYVQSSGVLAQEVLINDADWYDGGRGYALATNTNTGARAEHRYGSSTTNALRLLGVVGSGSAVDYTTASVNIGNGLEPWENPASGTGTSRAIQLNSAFAFSSSGLTLVINGAVAATNASGLVPSGVDKLEIAPVSAGAFTLRRFAFYPSLSNSELELITRP